MVDSTLRNFESQRLLQSSHIIFFCDYRKLFQQSLANFEFTLNWLGPSLTVSRLILLDLISHVRCETRQDTVGFGGNKENGGEGGWNGHGAIFYPLFTETLVCQLSKMELGFVNVSRASVNELNYCLAVSSQEIHFLAFWLFLVYYILHFPNVHVTFRSWNFGWNGV